METKPYNLQAPESIAKDFGGDKQKIAAAAQSGMLDPTAAVMAGMFIDRMRAAQAMEQAPNTTVAQDTMNPQGQMPQGQMPQPQPEGIDALPINEEMFEFAGGGVVAFAEGDRVRGPLSRALQNMTQKDRIAYLNNNPAAAQAMREEMARYTPILREREDPKETARQAEEKARISAEFSRDYHARQDQIDAGIAAKISAAASPEKRGVLGGVLQGAQEIGTGILGAGKVYGKTATALTKAQLYPIARYLIGDETIDDIKSLFSRVESGTATPEDEAAVARAEQKAAQEDAQQGEQGPPATTDPSNLQGAVAPPPEQAMQAGAAGLGSLTQQSGGAAPAGLGSLVDQSLAAATQLRAGIDTPDTPNAQAAFARNKMFNDMAGVNPDVLKNIADEVRQEREDNKTSKKDAANMRVVEAGLLIMAGESPHAMTNIGKGASKAFAGYADDLKEIKELDREMAKQERAIALAEDQMRRGEASGAAATYDSMLTKHAAAQEKYAGLAGDIYEVLQKGEYQKQVAKINASGVTDAADAQAHAEARRKMFADAGDQAIAQMKLTNDTIGGIKFSLLPYEEQWEKSATLRNQIFKDSWAAFLGDTGSTGGQSQFNPADGAVNQAVVNSY